MVKLLEKIIGLPDAFEIISIKDFLPILVLKGFKSIALCFLGKSLKHSIDSV